MVCRVLGVGIGAVYASCVMFLIVPTALFERLGPVEAARRSDLYMTGQKLSLGILLVVVLLPMVVVAAVVPLLIPPTPDTVGLHTMALTAMNGVFYATMILAQAVVYDARSRVFRWDAPDEPPSDPEGAVLAEPAV